MADGPAPTHRGSRRTRLSALAAATGGRVVGDDVIVTDVVHDSADVPPGALFVAVRGTRRDGHEFAAAAIEGGAAAVLAEHELPLGVPQILVSDSRAAMAPAAAECWGHPSRRLAVAGVTGTNGKTTVVTLVSGLLGVLDVPTAVIGTLTGARTTPESTDLQAELARLADLGVDVVAMEVSSHALALHRVDEVHFAVAGFTNLGLDHLDFHGTEQRYFDAKASLFDPRRADVAVINVDDVHGRLLRDAAPDGWPIVTVSLDALEGLAVTPGGSTFRWRGHEVELPLAGRFNVANAVIAAEICVVLGHDPARVAAAMARVVEPPGRFELVEGGQPFLVFVDYAHTPDGLERVLEAARELTAGRLFVVFGCGGDRDTSKRPRMGEAASRLADFVVITSDNPRSEDPSTIMSAVEKGCMDTRPVLEVDRSEAIRIALTAADPGDVVVIAGKGHETTQTFADRVIDFDDRVVARRVLDDLT